MTTVLLTVLILVVLAAIGAIVWGKGGTLQPAVNQLPELLPHMSDTELALCQIYLREWQVVIETQMHFNDLIIRFRTLTLTTFAALVGAVITVSKTADFPPRQATLLLLLPAVFWVCAFLLDFFYYQPLLLGSVAEAAKFDESALGAYGLFGLTACIRNHVPPARSLRLLVTYYALPLTAGLGLVTWWLARG